MAEYIFDLSVRAITMFVMCSFVGGCRQDTNTSNSAPHSDTSSSAPQQSLVEELKKRIKNFDEPISYCQFMDLRIKNQINQQQEDELIDFAYGHDNPVLFRTATKNVLPEHYSLNFVWLSSSLVDEQYPITGSDEERLEKNILNPLRDWQSKQPEAKINFWYDGAMVKNGSLDVTKARLKKIGFDIEKLWLRNLRDISSVKSNPDLFAESIPIYFKIDLAKAAVMDHVFKTDKVAYVASIDTDVTAITRKQLFDQRTLDALDSHGYIFGTAFVVEENSFMLLYNNPDIDIVKIHQDEVLNKALAIAQEKLSEGQPIDPQIVYHRYSFLRSAINKIRGRWNKELGLGKNMIFPPSQFGGGGYSEQQLTALKKALIPPQGCTAGP